MRSYKKKAAPQRQQDVAEVEGTVRHILADIKENRDDAVRDRTISTLNTHSKVAKKAP